MAVTFNQIPSNIRVPFAYFEINPGQSPYQSNSRLLLIGQKTSLGSAVPNEPILITGGENGLFGPGSMLAGEYKEARKIAPFREIWGGVLEDAPNATKATGTLAVEGAPVDLGGTIVIYVGDIRVATAVSSSMSNASILAAIISNINACDGMQVTAAKSVTGVKAVSTVTVGGPATAAGNASLNVNGVAYTTTVASGDTAAAIAANLANVINNAGGANCVAAVTGASVTLTALDTGTNPHAFTTAGSATATGVTVTTTAFAGGVKDTMTLTANNGGSLGNTIGVYTKLYSDDGTTADDMLTITPLQGGAGDPDMTALLANLGSDEYDWIVMPYASNAYMTQMTEFLDDRWGPMQQLYGHYFTVMEGTAGQLQGFCSARNDWHGTLLGVQNYPAPTYIIAAALGAAAADNLSDTPTLSLPLQTVELTGLRGPKAKADEWTITQRQSFYYSGVSALVVQRDRSIVLDRVISLYQRDKWGSPDMTWLDVNTMAQVMFGVRFMKQAITSTYPRAALVDDNPNNIQGFATADSIRDVIVHAYKALVGLGVFENADLFEQLLVVERDATDPNRVNAYLPLDHVNQLRIVAGNATSYLQYPST